MEHELLVDSILTKEPHPAIFSYYSLIKMIDRVE